MRDNKDSARRPARTARVNQELLLQNEDLMPRIVLIGRRVTGRKGLFGRFVDGSILSAYYLSLVTKPVLEL